MFGEPGVGSVGAPQRRGPRVRQWLPSRDPAPAAERRLRWRRRIRDDVDVDRSRIVVDKAYDGSTPGEEAAQLTG